MGKYKISRILISSPFFIIGAAFLIGAIWLAIDRLMEGLKLDESDGFFIGAFVVLCIFGGAFISFGKNALQEGHSEKSKPLISPIIYYLLGVLFVIPGVWSFFAGSLQALIVIAIGVGISIYGYGVSKKLKNNRTSANV